MKSEPGDPFLDRAKLDDLVVCKRMSPLAVICSTNIGRQVLLKRISTRRLTSFWVQSAWVVRNDRISATMGLPW